MADIRYGIGEAIDENAFGGLIGFVAKALVGGGSHVNDSEYDYYLGRCIGDAISALAGTGMTIDGIKTIIGSVIAGGGVTVGSVGTLTAGGVSIVAAGVAAGTIEITYGGTVVLMSAKNFEEDYSELSKREPKGQSFREGTKKQRDKWYGYNNRNFQKWWEKSGKRRWGYDIDGLDMARRVWEEWIQLGKPTVK